MPGAATRASAPGEVLSLADKMGGGRVQGWEEAVRQRVEGELGKRDGRWGEGFSMKRPGINLKQLQGCPRGTCAPTQGCPRVLSVPWGAVPLSATQPPPPGALPPTERSGAWHSVSGLQSCSPVSSYPQQSPLHPRPPRGSVLWDWGGEVAFLERFLACDRSSPHRPVRASKE